MWLVSSISSPDSPQKLDVANLRVLGTRVSAVVLCREWALCSLGGFLGGPGEWPFGRPTALWPSRLHSVSVLLFPQDTLDMHPEHPGLLESIYRPQFSFPWS